VGELFVQQFASRAAVEQHRTDALQSLIDPEAGARTVAMAKGMRQAPGQVDVPAFRIDNGAQIPVTIE